MFLQMFFHMVLLFSKVFNIIVFYLNLKPRALAQTVVL